MHRAAILALLLLAPIAAAAPEGIHLGLPTSDPTTALSVVWREPGSARDAVVTLEGPSGPREVPARVVDGPSVGTVYEATLDGLVPGAEHAYTIEGRSFPFRPPATALDPARPVRIVALGDMGTSERAQETARVVASLDPDLVLHAGDVSYAEGVQPLWESWFAMVEPVAASVPWVTALGNHETYTGSAVQGLLGIPSPAEIAFYKQRFSLPGNELAFSFDWGPIHVVVLDTFSERSIPRGEAEWLDADLAAHANASWTIVVLHEPPYSSNANHGSSERVREAFVPILARHGVDLVIAAHDHSYERSHPIGGVTYLVTGGAGRSLYEEWEMRPAWSAARGAAYHVTLLEVYPDRIEGRVVPTQGGSLEDVFTLRTSASGQVPAAIAEAPTPAIPVAFILAGILALAWARRR